MEKQRRRPFVVTLLAVGVFLLGVGYLLQFGQSLSHYSLNQQLPLSVPAWYPPISGFFWGGLWVFLAAGIWRRKEWARRAVLIILPVQIVFWAADWLLFSRSQIAIQSFGFDFTLRLVLACAGAAILTLCGRWDAEKPATDTPSQETGVENGQSHVE
jgi:hypothetical protein